MSNRNWKPFIRTHQNYNSDEMRLSLRTEGSLAISRSAFHALRSPAAVAMFYDPTAGLIGIAPAEPGSPNALPVRKNANGHQRRVSLVHFCTTFGIPMPKRSLNFPNPTFDPDGTLVLKLPRRSRRQLRSFGVTELGSCRSWGVAELRRYSRSAGILARQLLLIVKAQPSTAMRIERLQVRHRFLARERSMSPVRRWKKISVMVTIVTLPD